MAVWEEEAGAEFCKNVGGLLGTMIYRVEFRPRALKDLQGLDRGNQKRILAKIEMLKTDLQGDVKRLKNFSPNYRLRVGDYRVLFEVEASLVIVYRIKHRRQAYS
ncbi:type II toxin-antitoxin system RelE/ParE family toxin [Spirulina sp. CCNP1310]|uniref:type II toxin-antitoxin system RelE family toxin n=1 Tax=Spirulina sp. CCNP1310 TaxID=3110249 RepID=UPI002B1FDD92|nr:type II toxin-antitoxin system RelE/ParE family toxin [Spirulina sp. CCNP1310]MEA5421076.1 type II toxin-antitoxin system RelE/ParE family toxin [Spirulina sp. CCNP1310]